MRKLDWALTMFKKFHSTKLIRQAKKHQNQKQTNQTKTKSV